jgi:ribonuclease D
LRNRLLAQLKAAGRWALAQEDFKRVCKLDSFGSNNGRQDGVWRIAGSYELSSQQAAVLHELAEYRQQEALRLDRPLFKVINDQTLLEIARSAPSNRDELSQIQGMSRGQVQRHGDAAERGQTWLASRTALPPRTQARWRLPGTHGEPASVAQKTRKIEVESDVVLPDLLNALARQNPQDRTELEQILADVPGGWSSMG